MKRDICRRPNAEASSELCMKVLNRFIMNCDLSLVSDAAPPFMFSAYIFRAIFADRQEDYGMSIKQIGFSYRDFKDSVLADGWGSL